MNAIASTCLAAAFTTFALGCGDAGSMDAETDASSDSGTPTTNVATNPTNDGGDDPSNADATTDATTDPTADTGNTGLPCDDACTGAMMCDETGACVCAPGWTLEGSTCVAAPISDPTTRTRDEVCARWTDDRMFAMPLWTPGSGEMCDPGTVSYAAQVSGLRWLNYWRWMLGVGPVQVIPAVAQAEQECAKILGFEFSHSPMPETPCYTQAGAEACGASLIASGHGLIGQLDAYAMEIDQNLIHRRNVLAVGRAGIWLGDSGGPAAMHYGGAYPALASDPAFVAHPGPGVNIQSMVPSVWFVQAGAASTPPLVARVFVASTEEEMPMLLGHHYTDFNSFTPDGWFPVVDTAYRVDLIDDAGVLFASYETTLVSCP